MNILKSILASILAWFSGLFVAKQTIAQQSLGGQLNPTKELDGHVDTIFYILS